jgi:branched-chain amino acid transport system ATP-binding protein
MSTKPILEVVDLCKSFGALVVTDRVSLNVFPGELHALIGPNGAGKSTLINQITGELEADSGSIYFEQSLIKSENVPTRARLGMSRAYQVPQLFPSMTIAEHLIMADIAASRSGFQMWRKSAALLDLTLTQKSLLEQVGLLHLASKPTASLAHGEKRQLELALCLASQAKLLILDEPLAGLGPVESDQMITLLRSLKMKYGILLVEHDMDAVFSLADRISVLVNGAIIATGTVQMIKNDPLVKSAYLGEELDAH